MFSPQFDTEGKMQNVKEKTAASTRLFVVRHVAFLVAVQLWKAEVVVVNLEFFNKR